MAASFTQVAMAQNKVTNSKAQTTACNPVNLSYRFCTGYALKEAADPTMVLYKNEIIICSFKIGRLFSFKLI